jgi:hypothetical protein
MLTTLDVLHIKRDKGQFSLPVCHIYLLHYAISEGFNLEQLLSLAPVSVPLALYTFW